jgi:hypothetical protein
MIGDRNCAKIGVNILHLLKESAMIGVDTLVAPPFWLYKQAAGSFGEQSERPACVTLCHNSRAN